MGYGLEYAEERKMEFIPILIELLSPKAAVRMEINRATREGDEVKVWRVWMRLIEVWGVMLLAATPLLIVLAILLVRAK